MIMLPKAYLLTTSLIYTEKPNNSNALIKKANKKIESYNSVAIEGTARTSMWKAHFLG